MYVRYVHRVEKYVNSTLYVNTASKSKTHTSPWRSRSPLPQHGYGALIAAPPRKPLRDGFVEGAVEGFY